VATKGAISLIEPFVLPRLGYYQRGGAANKPRSIGDPLPTVTSSHGAGYLVEPFITQYHGGHGGQDRNHSPGDPLPTQDTSNRFGVVEPFLTRLAHQDGNAPRNHGLGDPVPTLTRSREFGVVEPLVVKYYDSGIAKPVSEALDTVTTKPRFGLVEGDQLDILFRMLQPHELAAAMGFPQGYWFAGNKENQVRQIGGAVTVNLARSLGKSLMERLA
jgi:DNA (cytosine-5)-methyltransferase 1